MRRLGLVAALLLCIPAPAVSADFVNHPDDTIDLIKTPVWSQTPTPAQIKAAFPFDGGKVDTGRADLVCRVRPDGSLWKCDSHSEWPRNNGFGHAAVALAGDFKLAIDPTDAPLPKNAAVELVVAFHNPGKPAPQPVITAPIWTRGVDPSSLPAIYPAKAVEAGVKAGRGVVDCTVDHGGRLGDCVPIREEPAGLGFGEAAVQVASAMAMSPWTTDGDPVDGAHVHLPVELVLPDSAPAPANP